MKGQKRWPATIPILLVIFAFGPILFDLVRFGQLAVYLIIIGMIGYLLVTARSTIVVPHRVVVLLLLFSFVTCWAAIATVITGPKPSSIRILSGLENYLQPLITITVVTISISLTEYSAKSILETVAVWFVGLLAANTLLMILHIPFDTTPLVKPFIVGFGEQTIENTVWWQAQVAGRYSGIFNQPATAGLMYSLGLFSMGYAIYNRPLSIWRVVTYLLVIIGGFLPVTKVYFLIGLPIFVMAALIELYKKPIHELSDWSYSTWLLISISLIVSVGLYLPTQWGGIDRLLRYFKPENLDPQMLLALYTANRLSRGSTVIDKFTRTLSQAPVTGFGLGEYAILDNGYMAFFVHGGIIGLVLLFGLFILLIRTAASGYDCQEGRILFFLTIVLAGGHVGLSAFTASRFSLVSWTFITLILVVLHENRLATGDEKSSSNSKLAIF